MEKVKWKMELDAGFWILDVGFQMENEKWEMENVGRFETREFGTLRKAQSVLIILSHIIPLSVAKDGKCKRAEVRELGGLGSVFDSQSYYFLFY